MLRELPSCDDAVVYKYLIIAVLTAAVAPTGSAATPAAHWCRQGDPPLYASADTTCELAGNLITDYVNICHDASNCRIWVDSPTQRIGYAITCDRRGGRFTGTVFCEGPVDTGVWTRFSDLI